MAGALMGFMCLPCTHTILVGIVLTCKKDKGETLTHSSGSEAFATHQRVTLARVPHLLAQHLLLADGPYEEGESRGGEGEETLSPQRSHQKYHGLGASWKRISRHETITVWYFSFCILRPSLVLSALHLLGNHNLDRKNHFNYLVYTLYLSDGFYQSLERTREITKNQ